MNNSTLTEQLIRFLDNDLTENERAELEAQLASDAAATEELERLKIARSLVQGYALRQEVAGVHMQMMKELRSENSEAPVKLAPVRNIARYALRIAASVLLILSVSAIYQYMTLSPEKIFADTYSPYEGATTRGAEGSSISALYNVHKFAEVVRAFEASTMHSTEELFLAGNAYLELNQLPAAIRSFEEVKSNNAAAGSKLFQDDADYYLAMAYLKNNDKEKALPIFEAIHKNPDHAYHDKVSSWDLKKLELAH